MYVFVLYFLYLRLRIFTSQPTSLIAGTTTQKSISTNQSNQQSVNKQKSYWFSFDQLKSKLSLTHTINDMSNTNRKAIKDAIQDD